jgi:hypothetical protein
MSLWAAAHSVALRFALFAVLLGWSCNGCMLHEPDRCSLQVPRPHLHRDCAHLQHCVHSPEPGTRQRRRRHANAATTMHLAAAAAAFEGSIKRRCHAMR